MSWPVVEFQSLFAESSRNGVYKPKEHHGIGAKLINMGELFAYDRVGPQDMARLVMTEQEMLKASVQSGDLLFGRRSLVEEGAGRCAIAWDISEPTTFESSIIRVRLDREQANPLFYFYYFRSPQGRSRIRAIVGGAAVKGIRGSDLQRISVERPPLEAQREVSAALSRYDDLIETNRRRIALLEESARLLYREWFVKLRFPGHEQVKKVNGVPEGWEHTSLADLAQINPDTIKAREAMDEIRYIDIAAVETGVIKPAEKVPFSEAPGRARRKVKHGDVIWSCVRPNRKSYALIWEPGEDTIVSTGFAVLSAKRVPFTYLYLATTTDDFTGYLSNRATGAAYPAVTAKDFESAMLLKPSQNVLQDFHEMVEPIFDMQENLKMQNRELAQARDALIPKLMSR